MGGRRIYVGNLPIDVRQDEVRDIFKKYGHVEMVDIKCKSGGPPFAFVDFEDDRDAEDAVRGRDGYEWDGCRLRVEFPRGVGPRGAGGVPVAERGGGRDAGRGGPPRRSEYRVTVTGLPPTGSWQDLKDHLRGAGEIFYADVFRDGEGAVEFASYEDMKRAVKKYDDTKFKSHLGESSYIRVIADEGGDRGGRRSRSRTPRRDRRSPSYGDRGGSRRGGRKSKSNSRSRSRSRSYSR